MQSFVENTQRVRNNADRAQVPGDDQTPLHMLLRLHEWQILMTEKYAVGRPGRRKPFYGVDVKKNTTNLNSLKSQMLSLVRPCYTSREA